MMKWMILLAGLLSLGHLSQAGDRELASKESLKDYNKEHRRLILNANHKEVENAAEWEAHKEYLDQIDKGNRF